MVREIEDPTPQSVSIMWDQVETLASDWDSYILVCDLRVSARPDSATRRELSRRLDRVKDDVRLLVAFTGTNVVLRAAAWFVLGRTGLPVRVLPDEEAALAEAERAL